MSLIWIVAACGLAAILSWIESAYGCSPHGERPRFLGRTSSGVEGLVFLTMGTRLLEIAIAVAIWITWGWQYCLIGSVIAMVCHSKLTRHYYEKELLNNLDVLLELLEEQGRPLNDENMERAIKVARNMVVDNMKGRSGPVSHIDDLLSQSNDMEQPLSKKDWHVGMTFFQKHNI